jgi:hypothetical protein
MKKQKKLIKTAFLTRAELINGSRSSCTREKLPETYEGMFDNISCFKQGTREFIDLSKIDKF